MIPAPPRRARAVLAWTFRHDPALPALLGDLHEEFVRRARGAGPGAARRWYWREALALSGGRLARRPFDIFRPSETMTDPHPLRAFLQDARYAFRALRRHPLFALFTAAVIGLGVGSTTAVYSVLEPLLLEPLDFAEPERLVWIGNHYENGDGSLSSITSRASNLRDFRTEARSFDGLTGYNAFATRVAHTLQAGERPERVTAVEVAGDFLDVLGVEPLLGRSFTEAEAMVDGPRAMILSHGFWLRRFDADPGVVGGTLNVDGEPVQVVGVLPPSFDFTSVFSPAVPVDYLAPFPIADETDQQGNTLIMVGRLRPGVSAQAAQADLDAVVAGLKEADPERWGLGARVVPLQERISAPLRPALLLLAAAAATVLLIVVVNVSNLLLARGPGRTREVAVRRAMGAPRSRIVRQLLLEGVLMSLAGAVLGAVLAVGVTRAVTASAAVQVPLLDRVGVDGGALAFAAVVALLTGVVVGAVPAFQVAEGEEAAALRATARGSSGGRAARRVREGLVVAEVALACTLLVVGGLLLRSFSAVLDVDLGFDPAGVVAWQIDPSGGFENPQAMADFYGALADRVDALAGVEAAGVVDAMPLGRNRTWTFRLPEDPQDGPGRSMYPHMAGPRYFETLGVSLLHGRSFQREDGPDAPLAVVMNESGARAAFGDPAAAVGRTLRMGWGEPEVVGVVEDLRTLSPETPPGTQVYFAYGQVWSFGSMDLAVRSDLPLEELRARVVPVLEAADPGMPSDVVFTLDSRVEASVSARRFVLGILTAFGMVAILLAGLGIYGVLAQSVAERRQEIGIRMALGAPASEVVGGVVRRTLLLAVLGIGAGAALSLVGSRLLGSLLFGVDPLDAVTFGGTALALLLVAGVAGAVPALRASRIRGTRALQSG